jgi:hypothetical protein
LPDQAKYPSDYNDIQVINTLDGFNLQPRLSIPFDRPIDPYSVNSQDVFLVRLGDTLPGGDKGGEVVGINQVVWDPATNILHVESDQLLDQHTTYALIVTNGVLDTTKPTGQPVQASEAFTRFRHGLNFGQAEDPALKAYRKDLIDGMAAAAAQAGVPESDIVTASVFTTQSATAMLEKIRDQIHAATPDPAVFTLGTGGERTVFNRADVTDITFNQQQTTVSGQLAPVPLDLKLLDLYPGVVGKIAFGKYVSPDYQVHPDAAGRAAGQPGEYMTEIATRTGTPVPTNPANGVFFNLFLPSGTKPNHGWPVAIFGHGQSDNKNVEPLSVAAAMANQGIATIAINIPGSGYGPFGTLTVNQGEGGPVTFNAGGRGIDQNGDGRIRAGEGQSATASRTIVQGRDTLRQTVADLMQLVRVIEVGMDVDGDGSHDLDSHNISYFGRSMGGMYGTDFLAIEPNVLTGVLHATGGPWVEHGLLSPGGRGLGGQAFASRTPPLLNSPGVTAIDGVSVSAPYFNENMPLRDRVPMTVTVLLPDGTTTSKVIQSPVINEVAGAMPIQEVIENIEWVSQSGNPVAYAPHLRKDPLPGVPAKSVLFQFAKGDRSMTNPTSTAILRAGGLKDLAGRTTFYRHDLALKDGRALPDNTHGFLTTTPTPSDGQLVFGNIALGAQRQIATFFASNGQVIDDLADITTSDGKRLFEVPIDEPRQEGLNFPGSVQATAQARVSGSRASGLIPTDATSDKLPTAMIAFGSMSAALTVPQAAPAVPVPLADPSAMPTASLVDLALDALTPLSWLEYGLDVNDLAAGLLPPARRRH